MLTWLTSQNGMTSINLNSGVALKIDDEKPWKLVAVTGIHTIVLGEFVSLDAAKKELKDLIDKAAPNKI